MKKSIFNAMLLSSMIFSVHAETILSKHVFSSKFASLIKQAHPEANVEIVKALEIKITFPENEESTSFLNNAYADYKNNPGQLDEILSAYAQSVTTPKELADAQLSKAQIFPVVKDRAYIQQMEEMFKNSDKKGLIYEKLNDVLYILYAFDTPTSIRFMTEDDLTDVGVEKNQLKTLAKENLKRTIPQIGLQGDPASISMLVADGTYEASFILFDDMWNKEQFPVKGNIVVYIPTRDLVLITGSEDEEHLALVHDILYNQGNEWSHIVSEVGFVRRENAWHVFNAN